MCKISEIAKGKKFVIIKQNNSVYLEDELHDLVIIHAFVCPYYALQTYSHFYTLQSITVLPKNSHNFLPWYHKIQIFVIHVPMGWSNGGRGNHLESYHLPLPLNHVIFFTTRLIASSFTLLIMLLDLVQPKTSF